MADSTHILLLAVGIAAFGAVLSARVIGCALGRRHYCWFCALTDGYEWVKAFFKRGES